MNIVQHQEGNKGWFAAIDGETEAGRMTYSIAGTGRIIIDHTEVDPAYGGKGVGKQMLMEAVAYARRDGIKILPLCPFAKKMFERDATISDVLF